MPRIIDQLFQTIFYLYPSQAAAEDAEEAGGCGFFISLPSEVANWRHIYAVTNKHVVDKGSCTFRFNLENGKSTVLETDERKWIKHPKGDDLAVLPIKVPNGVLWAHVMGEKEIIATPDIIGKYDIGQGDDVFIIGRFTNHAGKNQNKPVVRFGNIAQMPGDPIIQDDGFPQESFLIEARSLSGFSGSPVFVDIPAFARRPREGLQVSSKLEGPWLIGIDWGHLIDWKPVVDARGRPVGRPRDSMQVAANSGMMGVVPIWKLLEMLNDPKMKAQRKEQDEAALKKNPIVSSSDHKGVEDANPQHKEDFTSLLGEAATTKPQADQT